MKALTDISNLISSLRWTNIADIAIASVLVFAALRVIQRNIHKRVLIAVLTLLVLYLGALSYHFELTLRFLHVAFFFLGIGAILIFQEDIRRFVESSLFSVFTGYEDKELSDSWPNAILKSVASFSADRIGALIVIQQRVPLNHVASGGYRLNGEVTFPLLCSLFDPHSPGHDGAVIIRGSRVARFGVHLPLSRNHQTTGRGGTRHSAALGLSERNDAFIILVSEETGAIGVAKNGEFNLLSQPELKSQLLELNRTKSHPNIRSRFFAYLQRTLAQQVASIAIAIVLWATLVAPGTLEQRISLLPVTLEGVPKDLIVDDPSPGEFKVTLSGTSEAFALWPKEKQSIHVAVGAIRPGTQKIAIQPENLSLPAQMRVIQLEPSYLTLVVHKTRRLTVPVLLQINNRTLASSAFSFDIKPKEAVLIVRENDPGPTVILTEPIDMTSRKRGDRFDVNLLAPQKAFFTPETPQSVRVSIQ